MKKTAIQKRHEIYTSAFTNYNSFTSQSGSRMLGACEAITWAITGSFCNSDEICSKRKYPELFRFKQNDNMLWLDEERFSKLSYRKRIKMRKIVLQICAEMTKP
jgi:hypothetical protein